MRDLEALGRELQRSGKGGELKRLADSADGQRLARMLDAESVRQAAAGDGEAMRRLLGSVLSTGEGRRLAQQLSELMRDP